MGDTPFVIYNISTNVFNIMAIDSRGFDTIIVKTNEMIDYVPLTLDFNAFRPTPTGSEIKVNFQGNYYNGGFGSANNTLALAWSYKSKSGNDFIDGGMFTEGVDYSINGNRFSSNGDIILSTSLFPYQENYEIALHYTDKLIYQASVKSVPKGKPVLNWEDDLVNVNGVLTLNEKNIQENFTAVSSTEPTKGEKVWLQKSKNLFNINGNVNRYGINGASTTENAVSNGVLTSGFNAYHSHGSGQLFTNLNGRTFTCSAKVISNGTGVGGFLSIYDNYVEVKNVSITSGNIGSITYTGSSNNIIIGFSTNNGYNAQFTDIQVELGDSRTSYESFIVNEKIYTKNANGVYEEFNNNLQNYSTNEQIIGTWLGKPLYRKVIAQNISSVQMNYTIPHNIQNIDIIYVNSNSCCVSKTEDSMITTSLIAPSTYIATQAEYDYRYNNATVDKTAVGVHIGIYNHFGTATCYIILEYTKTTD